MKKMLLSALLCTTTFAATAQASSNSTVQGIEMPTVEMNTELQPVPLPIPTLPQTLDVEVTSVFNDLIEVIESEASDAELSSENYYKNSYETAYFTLQKVSLDIYFAMKKAERENRCQTTTTRYFSDNEYGSLETTAKFLVEAGFINFVSITRDIVSERKYAAKRHMLEDAFAEATLSYAHSFCSVEQSMRAM